MQRASQIDLGGATVLLPSFYPSISSVKTNLPLVDYVQLLVEVDFPQFLLSAYDYEHSSSEDRRQIDEYSKRAKNGGRVVLLDSGNYESFWLRDKEWLENSFHRACRNLGPTLAFSFDDQKPPDTLAGATIAAIGRATSDLQAMPTQTIVPIVHGGSNYIASTIANVVRELRPVMVAVPERELGDGLAQRCRTIASIRSRLNELEYYCPLHVLGTGNPYSLIALILSGADSFDGLEWCQTVVEFHTGQLSHFQHWDLFASTSPIPETTDLPYQQKALAHNLVFWADLMRTIRTFLREDTSSPVLDGILNRIRPILPVHIP